MEHRVVERPQRQRCFPRGLDADGGERDSQHGDLRADALAEVGAPGRERPRGEVSAHGPGVRGPSGQYPGEVGLSESGRQIGPSQLRGHQRRSRRMQPQGLAKRHAPSRRRCSGGFGSGGGPRGVVLEPGPSRRPSADRLGRPGGGGERGLRAQAVGIQRANDAALPDPARPRVHRHAGAEKRRDRLPRVESLVIATVGDTGGIAHDGQSLRRRREKHPRRRGTEVRERDPDRVGFEQRHAREVAAGGRQSPVPQPGLNRTEVAAGPVEGRAGSIRERHEHPGSPVRQRPRRAQGRAW